MQTDQKRVTMPAVGPPAHRLNSSCSRSSDSSRGLFQNAGLTIDKNLSLKGHKSLPIQVQIEELQQSIPEKQRPDFRAFYNDSKNQEAFLYFAQEKIKRMNTMVHQQDAIMDDSRLGSEESGYSLVPIRATDT